METTEQRMRAGLTAVYMRWKMLFDSGWGVTSLSTAMALEAVRSLSEAYPDDSRYLSALAELESEHGDLPRSKRFEQMPE